MFGTDFIARFSFWGLASYGGLYMYLSNPQKCMSNCRAEAMWCSIDPICVAGVMCNFWGRGEDNFLCGETFKSDVMDNWMECAFETEKCLDWPAPTASNDVECKDVSAAVVDVPADQLDGTWYGYYGHHADYDCVDCKQFVFTIENGEVTYDAKYRLDDYFGSKRVNEVHMAGTYNKGVMDVTYHDSGILHHQKWSVIGWENDAISMYWCGSSQSWQYDGAMILKRAGRGGPRPSMCKKQADTMIFNSAAITGFDVSSYCRLDSSQTCYHQFAAGLV